MRPRKISDKVHYPFKKVNVKWGKAPINGERKVLNTEIPYMVAISYYQKTGQKIARHLKKGLEDVGIKTFLDDDIPSSVKFDSDEWRERVDKAILESTKTVLIMTFGFNTRKEVIRELYYAWNNNKEVILCKDNNLPPNNMIIEKDGKETNLDDLNYVSFEDEEELLRKIGGIMFGHETLIKYDYKQKINNIISQQGRVWINGEHPLLEVIMVPKYKSDNLLEIPENIDLVNIAPWFRHGVSVTRELYYGDTLDNEDFQVYANGETYYNYLFVLDARDHYADNMIKEIYHNIFFITRILKKKNIVKEYIIQFNLYNMKGYPFYFTEHFREYFYLPPKHKNSFEYSFNTGDDWEQFKPLFYRIYKDIITDFGITGFDEKTIHKRNYNILKNSIFLYTHFPKQSITAVKIEAFGYEFE